MNNSFEQAIKAYLDNRAKADELFAVTYAKENKSIRECCNYIMQQAKKEGGSAVAIEDAVVYGWAIHYYDEDNINDVKDVAGSKVIAPEKAQEKTVEIKAKPKKKNNPSQLSLFDF
ncbi:MAG: Cas9 inhibitor AcrIIA9 family protein [Phocaeicola sp.]